MTATAAPDRAATNINALEETLPFLNHLTSHDYTPQQQATIKLLSSFKPSHPLLPRFTIRPMTHEDIPAVAHLMAHAFGQHGLFALALKVPVQGPAINNWMSRIRIALCDHCSFVIEDSEFDLSKTTETCECQAYTTEPVSAPTRIVSAAVSHDLASRITAFKLPPVGPYRMRSIRGLLGALAEKRTERIREIENKMLTKAQRDAREERLKAEKEKKEVHPERMQHLARTRDPEIDTVRTYPVSGEVLDVWLLATQISHTRHHLASTISQFLLYYLKHETRYQFATLDAAHPSTEKIWTSPAIGGQVMSRMKTKELEFVDEDGTTIRPFESVEYDMCTVDVEIKRP